jgi:uncharacterized Fe-S cluster-containing radical SAM superfamily protein
MQKPFDAFERASEVEKIVMEGSQRKYYRFRSSRHYGGIVTADAVGCNILCAYCWKSFESITGSDGSAFRYQLIALRELTQRSITVWPAIMIDIFGDEGEKQIREQVAEIGLEVEMEELHRYPFVLDNLRKRGIEV